MRANSNSTEQQQKYVEEPLSVSGARATKMHKVLQPIAMHFVSSKCKFIDIYLKLVTQYSLLKTIFAQNSFQSAKSAAF